MANKPITNNILSLKKSKLMTKDLSVKKHEKTNGKNKTNIKKIKLKSKKYNNKNTSKEK